MTNNNVHSNQPQQRRRYVWDALFFICMIHLCSLLSDARLQECLDTPCKSFSSDGSNTVFSACEPRNYKKNVASLGKIEISPKNATCGSPKDQFCSLKNRVSCMPCDNTRISQRHPPSHSLDGIHWHWWQTKPWPGLPGRPFEVNVTITLPKLFLLTDDILVDFHDGRPQKMIIDKSSDYGKTWQTMQYYANDCVGQFKMKATKIDIPNTATDMSFKPFCTEEFSTNYRWRNDDMVKVYVNARIDVLRRHGYNDTSLCSAMAGMDSDLGNFLLISNLKIRLIRPPFVQTDMDNNGFYEHSEHYGIKKIFIPGRCFCNGHAGRCSIGFKSARCECDHYTDGKDCEKCRILHWMRPWQQAYYSSTNKQGIVQECLSYRTYTKKRWTDFNSSSLLSSLTCECNGHSQRCEAVDKLGTICVDCRHNTIGRHCDKCKHEFYWDRSKLFTRTDACTACNCDPIGSRGKWCFENGQCKCRHHFAGRRCDKCKAGYLMKNNICTPAPICNTKRLNCTDLNVQSSGFQNCDYLTDERCSCVNQTRCFGNNAVSDEKGRNCGTSIYLCQFSSLLLLILLLFLYNIFCQIF